MGIISTLLYVLLALVILGVVVTVHEFGHYIAGRLTGIGVVEFSVGMGPRILGWKRKGIQYSLRALPLGGSCRFMGEDEDNKDPSAMNNQPVWKRAVTVAAGPALNFALAIIAAAILLTTGVFADETSYRVSTVLSQISEGSPAAQAGLLAGDQIVSVNGEMLADDEAGVERMREIVNAEDQSGALALTVKRADELLEVTLTPEFDEAEGRKLIGIVFTAGYERALKYSILRAIPESVKLNVRSTGDLFKALKGLVGKLFGAKETPESAGGITGPVGIVSTMTETVKANFNYSFSDGMATIVQWLWLLSLNLGIMNLLPLPALDGGRLVFMAIEAVRGKPISREKEGVTHLIGFALLILLICVVTWKDIARLFS